jgi:orotate phosphoribosyltransferase
VTSSEILGIFEKAGALIRNSHIVYTSGRHGSAYVNKDGLYPHTDLTSQLCREIAERLKDCQAEIVVAPALGGIILSQWVAHHLSEITGRKRYAVYAEKGADGESFVIRRGYDQLIRGKHVIILEDILTTGISVKRVVETVRACGGTVEAVAALCNRGGVKPADIGGVPRLEALFEITLESWEERDCPLCRQGVPFNTSVGKAGKK